MSDQTDNLVHLLTPYGLSEEEGTVYLYLSSHGFCTALSLSRALHLARTKVYRLIDTLKTKGLVEQKVDERGMKFGATHPRKLEHLVTAQEQQVAALKQSLPSLITHVEHLLPQTHSASKVLYYEGIEGLKQVGFNITRAKGTLRVFEMEHLSDFLPSNFAERIRQELVENHIVTKDLTNKSASPDFTQVTELIQHFSERRYIDQKELKINFEVLIYNDVYATYTYKNDTIFCVEIYNEQLAAMQKQLFDFIWQQAKPMEYTSPFGAAQVAV